jgi:CRP-like cAMP-binding protein
VGQHWPSRLDEALDAALFLIPFVTPSYFSSAACRTELEKFLELERRIGRQDLVLPVYFRTTEVFDQRRDALAVTLGERQYRDWREFRYKSVEEPNVIQELDLVADVIAKAIEGPFWPRAPSAKASASDQYSYESTASNRSIRPIFPIFSSLEPDKRAELYKHCRRMQYPANQVIIRKGDPAAHIFFFIRGMAEMSVLSEDGRKLVLSVIKPGDVFGELARVDALEWSADLVTREASEVLVLDQEDIVPFLARYPEVSLDMISILTERVRKLSQMLEDMTFLEGAARLAKRLVDLAREFGRPIAGGIRIELQLSQQQLGHMVGMSRESMNRHLRQWREDGLIRIDECHFVITDLQALQRVQTCADSE